MVVVLWLIRLIFPNAGWYVYYEQDFSPPDRIGPLSTKQDFEGVDFDDLYFNVWVRFNLW